MSSISKQVEDSERKHLEQLAASENEEADEAVIEDGAANKKIILKMMQRAAGHVQRHFSTAAETLAYADKLIQLEDRARHQGNMYMDMMKGMDARQFTADGTKDLAKLIVRWREELTAGIAELVDNNSFNPALPPSQVDEG